MPPQAAIRDQAVRALLADLQTNGLRDQTLVVLGTEFGRTPRINSNDGRDHHDEPFTCLMARAGMVGRDTYIDNFEGTPRRAAILDQAMSALLADLHAKGLLELTLVVLGTEFVRTSGTGKELVARAIGQSRYIPFDATSDRFTADFESALFPLNLSALSPTLIESELFGHKHGSFTGAVGDRKGWLEVCPQFGTVFLDEVGDLDPAIQVKLLRILQTRTFQRLGETQDRAFLGKVVAATNRNVADELKAGRFREDFYYRICSDIITTPSLRAQLADAPGDLGNLVLFIAGRIVGAEADAVTEEVVSWIDEHLGREYPWPGNIRELEQCVCNVLIRRSYEPLHPEPRDVEAELAEEMTAGRLTADELLRRYCTMVYVQCGAYEAAARRLGLDRRTVKTRVDAGLLEL